MIRFLTTRLPSELQEADLARISQSLVSVLRIKKPVEISLSFVSQAAIQTLNKRYRKKDRPTDVLSFSSREGGLPTDLSMITSSWGDVVVCPSYAKTESSRRCIALQEELVRLITHGVLHLAGYDHATVQDERTMFRLQERVVEEVTA